MGGKEVVIRTLDIGADKQIGYFNMPKELYLTGWVKNLHDGSVLLEAQGGTAQLRKFLIQLKSQKHIHIEKSTITVLSLQPYERGFRVVE